MTSSHKLARPALLLVGAVLSFGSVGTASFAIATGLVASTTDSTARYDATAIDRIVVHNAGRVRVTGVPDAIESAEASGSAESADGPEFPAASAPDGNSVAPDEITVRRTLYQSFSEPTIDDHVEGTTLYLESRCSGLAGRICFGDVEIVAPERVAVDIGGNDVQVRNTSGSVTITVRAGGASLSNVSGPLELDIFGSGVQATGVRSEQVSATLVAGALDMAFDASPLSVDAAVTGGSINLAVPSDATSYRIDSSGSTTVLVPVDPASRHRLNLSARGGNIRVANR